MKYLLLILFFLFCFPQGISEGLSLPPAEQIRYERRARQSESLHAFFTKYKCPDFNYQLIEHYLYVAEKNNLDYRLLPAISVLESQCGKRYPKWTNNLWGWNSARTGFDSLESGIDYIGGQLADGKYYSGKSLEQKLSTYCPSPTYPDRIKFLINQIIN